MLLVRLALRSIASHRARAALTLSGAVLGVFGMVAIATTLEALATGVREAVLHHGAGVFRVQRVLRYSGASGYEELSSYDPIGPEHLRFLGERTRLSGWVAGEAWSWGQRAVAGERATAEVVTVVGGSAESLVANSLHLGHGRFLTEADAEHARPVVVVGAKIAEYLFPGDAHHGIGKQLELRGQLLDVVGVLAPMPAIVDPQRLNLVFLPRPTFEKMWGTRSLYLTLKANDPERVNEAIAEAHALMRRARRLPVGAPDDFVVSSNQRVENMLTGLSLAMGAALGALTFICLLVGGIGLMNITLASVSQRTREIGVLMAIGARPGVVRLQFLTEAVVLALIGGTIGILMAFGVAGLASLVIGIPIGVPLWAVLLGLGSSTLTGLLAGLYPAARAAALDPIEALRQDP